MNRKRNILLWLITALYFAMAMLLLGLFHPWPALIIGASGALIVIILMLVMPGKMGLAKYSPRVFRAILRLESPSLPDPITINKGKFTIGRGKSCDYIIEGNKKVSKRHLSIIYNPSDRSHRVVDHDSTNGTTLNGVKLIPGEEKLIQLEDTLEIAGIVLRVKSAG